MVIRDTASKQIIGRVITNKSLTFDEAMELAGFEYIDGNESGWTKDNGKTLYDESTATMDYDG